VKAVSDVQKVFGNSARTYDRSAVVQRQAAQLLARRLADLAVHLPEGPVLELACGTGIFSAELVLLCANRELTISDLSPDMVTACRARLNAQAAFTVLDAESLWQSPPKKYALIACAFGAQWFENLGSAFDNIVEALLPGGYFLFSLPTDASFPEWKDVCARFGTEFTGNKLPTAGAISNYCVRNGYSSDLHATQICVSYDSSLAFFQSLRDLGATVRVRGDRRFDPASANDKQADSTVSLRKLIRKWDRDAGGKVTITYDVLYGNLRKKR
jgi:malonyl-CoA O-methyltransferase